MKVLLLGGTGASGERAAAYLAGDNHLPHAGELSLPLVDQQIAPWGITMKRPRSGYLPIQPR